MSLPSLVGEPRGFLYFLPSLLAGANFPSHISPGERQPKTEGGLLMTSETLWELFLATGLPEAYALFALLREEESAEKTA